MLESSLTGMSVWSAKKPTTLKTAKPARKEKMQLQTETMAASLSTLALRWLKLA